jgi:sugar phosphate isomerase/epimerase
VPRVASVKVDRIPAGGLGMHLYTVRDALAADPPGTLTALARMGYTCVGVSSFPRPPAEIRDLCAAAGLDPVVLHVRHDELTGDLAATLDAARTIGVRWLALSMFPRAMYTAAGMRLGARQLNDAGAVAREYGIGVLHHNHAAEFAEGRYDVLLAETDPATVGFELDVGWAHQAGADVRGLFAAHPGRFPVLHVKDHDGTGGWTDVGAGVVDFAHAFGTARAGGVRYWLVERDDQPAPLDTARRSHDFLEGLRF